MFSVEDFTILTRRAALCIQTYFKGRPVVRSAELMQRRVQQREMRREMRQAQDCEKGLRDKLGEARPISLPPEKKGEGDSLKLAKERPLPRAPTTPSNDHAAPPPSSSSSPSSPASPAPFFVPASGRGWRRTARRAKVRRLVQYVVEGT